MNYNGLIDLLAAHQADILCDSATKAIKELVRQVEYEQLCASELELQLAEVTKQCDELLAALLEISQVACDMSPEKKFADDAIASVKGQK